MAKLIPIVHGARVIGYRFYCPACKALHPYYTVKLPDYPVWWFDGNMDQPSFSPSLRMIQENNCHLYVTGGVLAYCNDCKHELRGQNVPMVEWDVERWCPVDVLHTINGKPVGNPTATQPPTVNATVATNTTQANQAVTHRPECGEVGNFGLVGDLGSNEKKD